MSGESGAVAMPKSSRHARITGNFAGGPVALLAAARKRPGLRLRTPLTSPSRVALNRGQLARNPADVADPPRQRGTERREMKTWTAEQLGAFLKSVADDRLHPLWHTLAMTGMRRGEALGLKWDDVDLEAARLSVRRALIPSGREVVISEPKTARGRRTIACTTCATPTPHSPCRPASTARSSPSASATPRSRSRWTPTRTRSRRCRKWRRR